MKGGKLNLDPLDISQHSLPQQLFKPAQAFFGGINSSGSAASTSAVSAAAVASVSTPAAAAAAPPQFGFAASAAAVAASAARISTKPLSSPPKKAAAAGTAKKDASIKKKKKQAPRGPSAYALFLKEQLSAVPASNDGRSYAQRSAAVAAAWKTLPASAKSRFEAASKAAKLALPPREPKAAKALSGYQLFVREKLPTLRDESAAGGGAVSAMRAVAEAWRAAPAQVKGEFAARAKAMGAKR